MSDIFDNCSRDEHGNYLVPHGLAILNMTPEQVETARTMMRTQEHAREVATFTRRPFALYSTCVKCGHDPEVTTEKPPRVRYTTNAETTDGCGKGEALVRQCRRCLFCWSERCVDAEA